MNKPIAGLLPLYIELYDISDSYMRPRIEAFYRKVADALEGKGLKVLRSPICRLKHEFGNAIRQFEAEGADIIITLHLAYSPSLESADALSVSQLPILVLDTTETWDFSPEQDPGEVLYNHGIHGVQDMCNLLIRNGKEFKIIAGHWLESDVLDRAVSMARSAKIVSSLKNSRVGIVGNPFVGMGDFAVPRDELKTRIGIQTIQYDARKGKELLESITDKELREEMEGNRKQFICLDVPDEVFSRASAAGLLVRKWLESENLSAFTVNFLDVDKRLGLPAMPFLEAGKAMARGIGYAGEGDILTAALAGALASTYPEVSFTEMFCPDWKNNSIFISHMGEMNLNLMSDTPRLMEKAFTFTDIGNTIAACGRFKRGKAVIVDLAPSRDGSFILIAVPGEVLDVVGEDKMESSVHGWFRPFMDIGRFLEEYSRNGGTHHVVLVYGEEKDEILVFGRMMGWKAVEIV